MDLSIGVVQTAYANGASTRFLESLGVSVVFACTGVKYLHPEAHKFDFGIYFEANGHGTVVFGDHAVKIIENTNVTQQLPKQAAAINILRLCLSLVNQAVGDALSDFFLIVVALSSFGWSLQDWNGLYDDLPSSQTKVLVRDRSIISTYDAERKVSTPAGLQEAIDRLVQASGPHARSFVRPSGTEDLVRVYTEAATQDAADKLARGVENAVKEWVQ